MSNRKSWTPTETVTKAVAQAREWNDSQVKIKAPPKQTHRNPPPPPNCVIVNSDAAWKVASQIAGLGWVIYFPDGPISFSKSVHHVGSALCAEALAMREALLKCKEFGLKRIICISDSTQLIQAVISGDALPELYGIVSFILDLSFSFDVISFVWISRENNVATDSAAKLCLAGEEAFYGCNYLGLNDLL